MPAKPRCPQCGAISNAIYRRRGTAATFQRIPKWATCPQHGPYPHANDHL